MLPLLLLALLTPVISAQVRLDDMHVSGKTWEETAFEPQVETQESKILTGKKVSTTKLDSLPVLSTNNFRQALSQTPGLSGADVGNEGFSSLSARGLGDPHETPNIQTLMDGLPISADMYGSPSNYFVPPFQMLDRIEFLRGGASLLYGPAIGGAINYVTRPPTQDRAFSGRVGVIGGSYKAFNSYNEVSGTKGHTSYLLGVNRRQSDGLRDRNSGFYAQMGQALIEQTISGQDKVWIRGNLYRGSHQTAGGLALNPAPGVYSFKNERFKNPLQYDHLEIQRAAYAAGWKRKRDQDEWQVTVFGGKLARDSFSQNRGTAPAGQGAIFNASSNVIQLQDFQTVAAESRYLRHWGLGESEQTFTAGVLVYHMDSPYREEQGQTGDAASGILQKRLIRQSITNSVFLENRTVYGNWTVTPGVRLENIRQVVDERYRASGASLRHEDNTHNVPLLGLGLTYTLTDVWEVYANASQSYTPVSFANAVPTGATDTISADIKESHSNTEEVGIRAQMQRLKVDVSAFQVYYANLFGRSGTSFINTGAGINRGLEAQAQWRALDKLELYANAMFLRARFINGPNDGKTPQYAPDFLTRAGLIFHPSDRDKIALMGTVVDQQYGDDTNSDSFRIPGYTVVDLTFEKTLYGNLQLVGGLNNLLDRKYYTRIRGQGIDPSAPRNYYLGLQAQF